MLFVKRHLMTAMSLAMFAHALPAQNVVSQKIDAQIDKTLKMKKVAASPASDDAEFLRRVYLDLTGRIPTVEKAVAFLDSKDPARRSKLIDELLGSPEYGQHFSGLWSQLLLGTEIAAKDRAAFRGWFAGRLHEGDSWDKLVREMLSAEGDSKAHPATIFIAAQTEDNKVLPNLMAASTTRYFLGVQLQCAECHNHPFTGWKQTEFWGVAAFFSKVKTKPADKTAPAGITEAFFSNDPKRPPSPAPKEANITLPKTAGQGAGKVVKAKFLEADEPVLDTEKPYRPTLADWIVAKDNKFFARATANRVWSQLFGRGLVNPVDDMHADNVPSHPDLLQLLTDELKSSGFDLKSLIRTICNSQTYQRTSRPLPGNLDDRELFSHMATKVMSSETLYESLVRALGVKELNVTTGKAMTAGIGGAAKAGVNSSRDKFITFFKTQDADSVATDFTHGIPQALNLMNDAQFNRGTPAIDGVIAAKLTREQAVERLFLAALARRPTAAESRRLSQYVESEGDPVKGYTGVLWILLNTPEFILVR